MKHQYISFVASILTILAFSHIVHRVHITKNTSHLTYTWILLVLMSQFLLVLYGMINHSFGIYIPSSILLTEIIYILYVKIHYLEDFEVL